MKFKNLLFLPLLSLFSLVACNNNSDPYKDKVTKDYDNLYKESGYLKTDYQSGDKIETKDLVIKFNSESIDYLNDAKDIEDNKYYFCTSNDAPTNSRILPSSTLNTGKRTENTCIYIAVISSGQAYVSKKIDIKITNQQALSPLVYYIGVPVLIVTCAGIVAFAKKYKEKHP